MDMDSQLVNQFEREIAEFNDWRSGLIESIQECQQWLDELGHLSVQQSVTFFELKNALKTGRILIAFLAEFSRGKTELINALFFSRYHERLLPSGVGRTTMCPTEIYHDPAEAPYLHLLPIETRMRADPIAQLKSSPIDWVQIRLDLDDAAKVKAAFAALTEVKRVRVIDAQLMGLAPLIDTDANLGEDDLVEIPCWRYARINFPHPMLTNGISILDTPGVNALGLEPELTLATLPSAQAVVFLLGADTGVTKSDLEIWNRYVRASLPEKIAVLNKADLIIDALKGADEVRSDLGRVLDTSSRTLGIPRDRIFPLSAKTALLGRIEGDEVTVRRSGIQRLESYLANELAPMQRQVLAKAIASEIGDAIAVSRRLCEKRLESYDASMADLKRVAGSGKTAIEHEWQMVATERERFNLAVQEFRSARISLNASRDELASMLSSDKLNSLCAAAHEVVDGSWTTRGLIRGLKAIIGALTSEFEAVKNVGDGVRNAMHGTYTQFEKEFGFPPLELRILDFEKSFTSLRLLRYEAETFCADPKNIVLLEKSFMIKRFWETIIHQARRIFDGARWESENWLASVLLPIEAQIKEHKTQIQKRVDRLAKLNERTGTVQGEIARVQIERNKTLAHLQKMMNLEERLSVAERAAVDKKAA